MMRLREAHARLARGLVRHPLAVLGAFAAMAAGTVFLLARFRVEPDIQSMFPRDEPTLRLTRKLQRETPPQRTILVIFRAGRPEEIEEALPRVVKELRASPYLVRVVATREEFAGPRAEWVRRAPLGTLPEEWVDRLQDQLTGPARRVELEATRQRLAEDPIAGKPLALRDPIGIRWFFDAAGECLTRRFPGKLRRGTPYLLFEGPAVAFVRAIGKEDSFNARFSRVLMEDVRSRMARALGDGPVCAELAGGYVTGSFQAGTLRKDLTFQAGTSAILVLLFLAGFTRSLFAPPLILCPIALAIVAALAAGGMFLGPLTPLCASAAAILTAQGIDFTVHLFARARAERRSTGCRDAITSAQLSLGRPFLGACATTISPFLVFLASRFPGFEQFGLLLALGMGLCLVCTMTLFPVLLLALDRPLLRAAQTVPLAVRIAQAAYGGRWKVPVALGVGALAAASWIYALASGVRVELDLRNSMPPGDPGLVALERLERDLGISMSPVFALVDARIPLDVLRIRVEALRARGAIRAVDGPHDLFPPPARRDRVDRFLRETRGWVEGTLSEMAALGFQPAPFRKGLEELQRRLSEPPSGIDSLHLPGFEELRALYEVEEAGRRHWVVYLFPGASLWEAGERAAFDRAAREALGAEVPFYSVFHLPNHYGAVLREDLGVVAIATGAAVVLLTILSIGRVRAGLLALVPALTSTGTALGLQAVMGGAINLMNAVAIPILLGIGVDGGIHFMTRIRAGADPATALRDTGPGIWGSSATTLLGFGPIALSVTPGLAQVGVLVAAGAAASLGTTFFLLPALARALPRQVG